MTTWIRKSIQTSFDAVGEKLRGLRNRLQGIEDDLPSSLYSEDVEECTRTFRDKVYFKNLSTADKINEIKRLGELAYIGDEETTMKASRCLFSIFMLIREKNNVRALTIQCLKTLSAICFGNKIVTSKLQDKRTMQMIVQLMHLPQDFDVSAWACYFVCVSTAGNPVLLHAFLEFPGFKDKLFKASAFRYSWAAFNFNVAQYMYWVFGYAYEDAYYMNTNRHVHTENMRKAAMTLTDRIRASDQAIKIPKRGTRISQAFNAFRHSVFSTRSSHLTATTDPDTMRQMFQLEDDKCDI